MILVWPIIVNHSERRFSRLGNLGPRPQTTHGIDTICPKAKSQSIPPRTVSHTLTRFPFSRMRMWQWQRASRVSSEQTSAERCSMQAEWRSGNRAVISVALQTPPSFYNIVSSNSLLVNATRVFVSERQTLLNRTHVDASMDMADTKSNQCLIRCSGERVKRSKRRSIVPCKSSNVHSHSPRMLQYMMIVSSIVATHQYADENHNPSRDKGSCTELDELRLCMERIGTVTPERSSHANPKFF